MFGPAHRMWVDLQDHLGIVIDAPTRRRLRSHPLIRMYAMGIYQIWREIQEDLLSCRVRP